MRIGIPRALMFYRYYPFLKIFLEGCGHEVVSSPPTDLRILEGGVESCVDDVCVAVKVFYGHVRYLEGVADALLVPRPVSVEKGPHDTFTCPKLIAAPDMARFYRKRPPVLLEWVLDARKVPWWWGCLRLAARLRVPPGKARKAYRAACRAQRRFESLLSRGWLPDEAVEIWEDLVYERREAKVPPVRRMGRGIDAGEPSMRIRPGGEDGGPIPLISRFPAAGRPPVDEGMGRTRLRLEKAMCLPRFSEKLAHVPLPRGKRKDMAHISYNGVDYHLTSVRDRTVGGNSGRTVVGVVGHPYLLGDRLVNKDLIRWLEKSGAFVVPCTMLSPQELKEEFSRLPDMSWSYERELLAATSFFARCPEVQGIVYLTSFGCGPDSMVMEMARREIISRFGKPFLEVVLDEHSADVAVRTRAEAFVDMLDRRMPVKGGRV